MKKFLHHQKGAFALLLALFLGLGTAYASDFSEMYSGKTFYFNIIDATNHYVEITFPGTSHTNPWSGHTMPTGSLTLPSTISHDGTNYPVTAIGAYAFYECDGLTGSLTIPSSVTTIGEAAFIECTGFNGTLTIGTGVTSMGASAFKNCSGFTHVNYNAVNCDDVAEEDKPFEGCSGTLTIGNNVQRIPASMFYECTGFTGPLTIGSAVTSIEWSAFYGCSGFTGTLTIPNTVEKIRGAAFRDCSGFSGSLMLPNSVTEIGWSAFNGCSGFTGSLTIPNSVTWIGAYAFSGCGFTGSLIIPNSVTEIGGSAFYGCSGFTGSLTIPNSVTWIGAYAFWGCTGFNGTLTIGSSVTELYTKTFENCNGFTFMMVYPETPPTMVPDVFENVPKTIPVRVPCGKLNAYQNASVWNEFTNMQDYCDPLTYEINPDGVSVTVTGHVDGTNATGELFIPETKVIEGVAYTVTAIGDYAFSSCSGLTGSLVIPNTVTSIGEFAFSSCDGLTGNLILSNFLITIGQYAFQDCPGFTGNLTLPNTLTTLGDGAFYLCSGFNGNLTLPNSLTAIGKDTFASCKFIGSLSIPNTVTSIGDYAFHLCTGFTGSLTIPNAVTTIGYLAFYGCSGFDGTLTIGTGVTSIGSSAFYGCNHFTHVNYNAVNCADINSLTAKPFENCTGTISIGNTVQRIPAYLFFEADGLTGSLTIPNSVTTIGSCAFAGCDGFTGSLTIGNSVTTIEFGGFGWCPNFTTLTLGSSLTTIGAQAFYVDTGFTGTLTIPNSVTYIGSHAFDYCYNFTGPLTIPNSVACIESMAFQDCYGFTGALTIGTSLTELGSGAFYNCTGFTQVNYNAINCAVVPFSDGSYSSPFESCEGTLNIGSNVQRIPAYLFKDCTGFTGSLYIPSSVTEVGANAFDNCTGFTGSLILGNSLTTIGGFAFYGMHFTGSLTIPDSVTSLGEYAFAWCGYFTGSLTIGNSLTTIPVSAFYQCNNFTSLTMPSSVTTIEGYAFSRCSSLTSMTVHAETPPTFGVEAFELVSKNIPVYVPCGSIGDYQAANGWSTFTNYQCIPWTVTLSANPWDGGTVSGEGTYANGASCTVLATPNDNYLFLHWRENGEVVSSNASYSFTVNGDTELEAVFMNMSNAGTVIGEGEDANTNLPSHSYWKYGLSQQIYTANELGGSFTINSISFFNSGEETKTRRYDVYLDHTSKSSFTSATDWVAESQAECVFSGNVTMRAGMWTTIVLDTPFSYNGADNLLLTMDDNTGSYTAAPYMACRVYTAPQSYQAIYARSDNTNYAPHAPSSYNGTRLSVKNQIIFNRPVYTITATANNAAMGTVSGAGQYGYGDLCRLEATANSGHTFLDWMDINGVAATDEAEYEFFVTGDRTLRANFFEGTDVCNLTFDFDNYNSGWNDNYLEVHFGNGMSHLFGVTNGESTASYTLPFINGSHVELNLQIGSFSDQYHVDVRYANGNMACTSDVLVGESSYEFDVDCDEKPAAWVYVGDGDDITNTYLPSYSYYNYGLSQQIYTAAEIGSAGNITSIAFYNQGEDNTETRTYDIYLKPTNKFEFFNGTDWVSVSEEDKMFSGNVTMVSGKWTIITFDVPFVYDGTSNLVLVVDDNSGSYTNEPHMSCRVFDANGNQAIQIYGDGLNYNPSHPSSYNGTLMAVKNQLYFGFTSSLDCWSPIHLSFTDITSNSATLNWEGYQDSYNVRYRVAPPFYEDFEEAASFATDWTFISMNAINDIGGTGANPAGIYTTAAHSGTYGFRFSSFHSAATGESYNQYLVSPKLTVTGELKFWFRKTNNSEENFYVGYSTTDKNITNFTWTEDLVPTASWQEYTLQLPSNVKYIAFHYYGDYAWYVYLDDITIGGTGIPMGDWVTVNNVVGTTTEITDLDPATNYVWQVQGNNTSCNDEGVTQWSKKATFTTKCEAFLVDAENPFFEGFEGEAFAPNCWHTYSTDSYQWTRNTSSNYVHSGSASAYSYYYGDNYLVLPDLELSSNASAAQLSFWSYNRYPSDFAAGNNTVVLLDGNTETVLWSAAAVSAQWEETTIDLTPYLGQTVSIAFKYSGNNGNGWYVDDVEVSVEPVTIVTQTIALTEGVNWVSFYVETTLDDLKAALVSTGGINIVIQAKNGSTTWNGRRWLGSVGGFSLTQMYKIHVTSDCEIALEGMPLNPAEHPITISEGTNWIGFPCSESMTLNTAFAGFSVNQDAVSSKSGSSTWNGRRWLGLLTTLVPGQGYIYNSASSTPRVFSFGQHAYVDLGLPSGTKWATCNVGASTPEGYGDYFAWGETTPKETYNWSNYQHCNGSRTTLTKYCDDASYGYNGFTDDLTTLLPEDDAATANWGSDWRMPTVEEWQELLNNTTQTWTTQNGVNGRLFTAANGNSLFLPAAGFRSDSLYDAGSFGIYCSSSLTTSIPYDTWLLNLGSDIYYMISGYRYYGTSVRPVRVGSQN